MKCTGCQADLPNPKDPSERRVKCAACGRELDLAMAAALEGTAAISAPAPTPSDPNDPLVGTSFAGGRYVIASVLGVGGMGRVYRAKQALLHRDVAIKILSPELAADEQFRRRFDREAGTLASLDHPNIVAIHDMGVENGTPYIVMTLVVGRDAKPINLRTLLDAGPVDEELCLRVVQQTCSALEYAHRKGIIHRDIKPANILLDADGNAKMADFGIARALGADGAGHTLTTPGSVLGTIKYMAPEQMADSSKADPRSDLYSLGVVFYEMLTGHAPVGRFEMPSEERTGLDCRLDGIVDRALRRVADQRYQTADQMARDISRITTERDFGRLRVDDDAKGPKSHGPKAAAPVADSAARAHAAASSRGTGEKAEAPANAARSAAAPNPKDRAVAPPPVARTEEGPRAPRKGIPAAAWVAGGLVVAGLASIPLWASKSGKGDDAGSKKPTDVSDVGKPKPPPVKPGELIVPAPAPPDPKPAPTNEPSPWATGMDKPPAMDETTPPEKEPTIAPPMADSPPAPAVEPAVEIQRDAIVNLLMNGNGVSPEDVDATRNALAAATSGRKTDVAGAKAATAAALGVLGKGGAKNIEALKRGIPDTLVREIISRAGKETDENVRKSLSAVFEEAKIKEGKVTDAVAMGPDWVLLKVEAANLEAEGDDDKVFHSTALAIREGGAWRVLLDFHD
jgi:serine/threonine protein kinase